MLSAQVAPMQHAADDATLTDHVDEHRSDNWASYGAQRFPFPSLASHDCTLASAHSDEGVHSFHYLPLVADAMLSLQKLQGSCRLIPRSDHACMRPSSCMGAKAGEASAGSML